MGRVIHTKVRGVSHANGDGTSRQMLICNLFGGESVELRREPENPVDSNAIAVYSRGQQIGYLSAELAAELSPKVDMGQKYLAGTITAITGENESWDESPDDERDSDGPHLLGINLTVEVNDLTISSILPVEFKIAGFQVILYADAERVGIAIDQTPQSDPASQVFHYAPPSADEITLFIRFYLDQGGLAAMLYLGRMVELHYALMRWLELARAERKTTSSGGYRLARPIDCFGVRIRNKTPCNRKTTSADGLCSQCRRGANLFNIEFRCKDEV